MPRHTAQERLRRRLGFAPATSPQPRTSGFQSPLLQPQRGGRTGASFLSPGREARLPEVDGDAAAPIAGASSRLAGLAGTQAAAGASPRTDINVGPGLDGPGADRGALGDGGGGPPFDFGDVKPREPRLPRDTTSFQECVAEGFGETICRLIHEGVPPAPDQGGGGADGGSDGGAGNGGGGGGQRVRPGETDSRLGEISEALNALLLSTLQNPSRFDIDAVREFQDFQTSELERQAQQARGRLKVGAARRGTFFGSPLTRGLVGVESELQRGLGALGAGLSLEQARTQGADRIRAIQQGRGLLGQQESAEQFRAQLAASLLGLGLQGGPNAALAPAFLGTPTGAGAGGGGLGGLGLLFALLMSGRGGGGNEIGTAANTRFA